MSTYDKLLDLTDIFIQESGYEGFSFADLAREAGIRKASIFHHFPTKAALGMAWCETKIEQLNHLEATLQQLPAGKAQLQGYLEAFSGCAENGRMCGLHSIQTDSHLYVPELQASVNKLVKRELEILGAILQRGKDSGELTFALPVPDMAVIVCNALKGSLMLNRAEPDVYDNTVRGLMALLSS